MFIFLWFVTIFKIFFLIDLDGYYIVRMTRVNPDRNIFSINVELTSTSFYSTARFGPSPSTNFKLENLLWLIINIHCISISSSNWVNHKFINHNCTFTNHQDPVWTLRLAGLDEIVFNSHHTVQILKSFIFLHYIWHATNIS